MWLVGFFIEYYDERRFYPPRKRLLQNYYIYLKFALASNAGGFCLCSLRCSHLFWFNDRGLWRVEIANHWVTARAKEGL